MLLSFSHINLSSGSNLSFLVFCFFSSVRQFFARITTPDLWLKSKPNIFITSKLFTIFVLQFEGSKIWFLWFKYVIILVYCLFFLSLNHIFIILQFRYFLLLFRSITKFSSLPPFFIWLLKSSIIKIWFFIFSFNGSNFLIFVKFINFFFRCYCWCIDLHYSYGVIVSLLNFWSWLFFPGNTFKFY